ncbi:hypothetical protein I312_106054 [Cryptococcus bacillisporus CA1280]|uniref:uncharacterized protein n=1 Tax=Cryptococcus bacillisporus CA1280 TaxID=1296109 RepID=UPI00336737C7
MDFAFRDLFEKKNFEALDTCVFVVISTAIRQLPINIFILGSVGSGLSATGSHFGFFFVLVSGDFTALDIGIVGCTVVGLYLPSHRL